ncbi:MAG TPA: prephenate dehydrogenase/arogenate dehydrogenase family protein [Methanospirillum sp.]|uniref:prephenate dehydrogenase/arogenate dehydrogenase family protein n=1 Tax=Methanospirillum sp. TaxID=45200 RepID=UPI002CE286B7|nr:prephenate dehydrogenase/arogenate dehydrogenase family protein [Methanospirillum sp.]HWQ64280.1 prephenate dehydrogenase/arogenate dehydrogenase family protein [Methanospirillum sp.]
MKVGIIGGTGQMGAFFARVFTTAGHEVRVSGRKTELTNRDLAEQSDLVIISVPIHSTVPVIKEITPFLKKEQIVSDLTSLKSGPVTAMMESAADVIGMHPMFGPTAESLKGQTVVITPGRCSDDQIKLLFDIFSDQGAQVTVTTPEHHDRMMAVIQGLTHFKALVMAETMKLLSITPEETELFMSPIYRIETSVAGRILAQDPMLYADILSQNPEVSHVLETCCKAAGNLKNVIESGDTDAFAELFLADRKWFGEYCNRSLEMTDKLIAAMVKA